MERRCDGDNAGYNKNIPAGALVTDLGTSQQPANAPLLVSTLGYISGKVFLEKAAPLDGVYVAGTDSPIAGVDIQLVSGATCGGALLFTTHTDAQGNYLFSDLNAGTYSVCEPTQPTGTLNSDYSARDDCFSRCKFGGRGYGLQSDNDNEPDRRYRAGYGWGRSDPRQRFAQ